MRPRKPAKLALTVTRNDAGHLELIGYIDKNEIEWLCRQLRSLGDGNDHIHIYGGDALFYGSEFPLKCRENEVAVSEFQINCIDPDDFYDNPFELQPVKGTS
jgi:hypothetical protein